MTEHTKPASESICTEPELADRFPDYLAGRLTLAEAKEIERHLAGCAHCRLQMDLWLFIFEESFVSNSGADSPHS
jgi:hypothetical protein